MKTIRNRIKRLTALAVTAVLTLVNSAVPAVFADSEPDFNVKTNTPAHVVFLGDSIAAGYGLEGYSPDDKSKCSSYANLLTAVFASELPSEAGFTASNVAKDGQTSNGLKKRLKEGEFDTELKDADALFVSIGGNDLLLPLLDLADTSNGFRDIFTKFSELEGVLDEHLDKFEKNLPEIISLMREKTGRDDTVIFLQTLYNPFEDYFIPQLDEMAQEKIGRLNSITISAAEKYDCVLVDIDTAFKGSCKELTNIAKIDIHPNADGHSKIADNILSAVREKEFTYYSYEAEREYHEEQLRIQQEKMAKLRSQKKMAISLFAGAGSVTFVLIIVAAVKRARR